MFNSLTGIISHKSPQTVYLQIGGVEWDIMVPDTALDVLAPLGAEAKIYTWLYHKEDSMRIFGFASAADRSVFVDLMKVDGVGPKAAIKILSSITAKELAATLDAEDMARLERISGIGKKTAQKMMLTLKGKLSLDDDSFAGKSSAGGRSSSAVSPWADVITALVNMGYDKRLCEEAITKLTAELAEDSDFVGKNRAAQEDVLFRRAIVELV